MAENTTPIFIGSVRAGTGVLTSGDSTLQSIFTSGADGSRIDSVKLAADATTTAARFQLLLNDGSNDRIIYDGLVSAITASSTVAAWATTIALGLVVPTGYTLKARLVSGANTSGAGIDVTAFGGDY